MLPAEDAQVLVFLVQIKDKEFHGGHDKEFDALILDEDSEDKVRREAISAHPLPSSLVG